YGAGGIGLCAIAAAAIVDAYPIVAVDVADEKLAFARRFGATHTINARDVDSVAAGLELTDGGADYAIDAVGRPRPTGQAEARNGERISRPAARRHGPAGGTDPTGGGRSPRHRPVRGRALLYTHYRRGLPSRPGFPYLRPLVPGGETAARRAGDQALPARPDQ